MRTFRLSTLLAVTLVAAILIGMNMTPWPTALRIRSSLALDVVDCYGWPLTINFEQGHSKWIWYKRLNYNNIAINCAVAVLLLVGTAFAANRLLAGRSESKE